MAIDFSGLSHIGMQYVSESRSYCKDNKMFQLQSAMNEFISLPAGLHKENTMYFQYVNLVFLILEQTGTHCRHQFTSCITLHNKV